MKEVFRSRVLCNSLGLALILLAPNMGDALAIPFSKQWENAWNHPSQKKIEISNKLNLNHRQGNIVSDKNPLHLAIDGIGYFAVFDPKTQAVYYTRKGNFILRKDGKLLTEEGFELYLNRTLELAQQLIMVDQDGTIWKCDADSKSYIEEARIPLAIFEHTEKLQPVPGKFGYFKAVPATGQMILSIPGISGFGLIIGNALEDLRHPDIPLPNNHCKQPGQPLVQTGKILDVAIDGPGFFVLTNPTTGETMFTRQGRFKVRYPDESPQDFTAFTSHTIMTLQGYLLNVLSQPDNSTGVGIDDNQTVAAIDPQGNIMVKTGSQVIKLGQIKLAVFKEPSVLETFSYSMQSILRIKRELQNARTPLYVEVFPGEQGTGKIKSGVYEDCFTDMFATPKRL